MAAQNLAPTVEPPVVLVVDGDETTREYLKTNLQREGYRVLTAGSAQSAVQQSFTIQPDLMLLELDLPDVPGFEVCRAVRPQLIFPIVIVSQRSDEVDKVLGLELGADDYLTKPYSWRELLARIHAQLRRVRLVRPVYVPTTLLESNPPPPPSSRLTLDDITIHLDQRLVTRAGQPVPMTPKEFELLTYLALHPRQVLTRQELLGRVWGSQDLSNAKTVDVHIRWLRSKLEQDPANPRLIQTVYGIGYRFSSGNPE